MKTTKTYYLLTLVALLALGVFTWLKYQPRIKKPEPQATIQLKQKSFAELPGWKNAKVKKSLLAFQVSCKTFLRQDPERIVGSEYFPLKAKDWQPACR